MSGWLEDYNHTLVYWRFVSMGHGAQYVMMDLGRQHLVRQVPMWCADNWDTKMEVSTTLNESTVVYLFQKCGGSNRHFIYVAL